ncbi:MAG: hypothetical protein RBT65_19435, partial [Methanolobus sp.]|nr:hypothetical protein [Methanolobus sp.]
QSGILLPHTVKELLYSLKAWSIALFNRDLFLTFYFKSLYYINKILRVLIWVPIFGSIIYLLKLYIHREKPENEDQESKKLVCYKAFEEKYLNPVYNYLFSWRIFLKYESRIYKIILAVILLNIYRITAIGVDTFSWYIYLLRTFNLSSTIPLVLSALIDVLTILMTKNIVIIVMILLFLRHRLQIKRSTEAVRRLQAFNKEKSNSLPIVTLMSGPPGSGKTQVGTSIVLDIEEGRLRGEALSIMKKHSMYFPGFPFSLLEDYIAQGVKSRQFVNRAQLKNELEKMFYEDEGKDFSSTFRYSLQKEKTTHFDGLKAVSLIYSIVAYAQAFFLYNAERPLAFANLGLKFNYVRQGYFPLYDYNYIDRDYEYFYLMDYKYQLSNIINFNSRRIYTRMSRSISEEDNRFIMDGQIEFVTEGDKERGNKDDHVGQSRDDYDANQLNDGYNTSLKLTRHEFSIDSTNFSYYITDLQRQNSINADIRETAEARWEIKVRSDLQVTLRSFHWAYIFYNTLINFFDDYYYTFRANRKDKTLYNYLLQKAVSRLSNRYNRLIKLYGYETITIRDRRNVTSDSSGDSKNIVYYIISRKMYADIYRTDCYSSYFEGERLKASKGFYDAAQYQDTMATTEELDKQNSYLIEKIKSGTKI